MPEPQDHPLDAALRAQAERRRAELPDSVEMPGPMRAALQRAVAHQQREHPARPVTWLDRFFRWQSLFATACTAVLTVGLFAWSQGWWTKSQLPSASEQTAAPAPRAVLDALEKREVAEDRRSVAEPPAAAKAEEETNRARPQPEVAQPPIVAAAPPAVQPPIVAAAPPAPVEAARGRDAAPTGQLGAAWRETAPATPAKRREEPLLGGLPAPAPEAQKDASSFRLKKSDVPVLADAPEPAFGAFSERKQTTGGPGSSGRADRFSLSELAQPALPTAPTSALPPADSKAASATTAAPAAKPKEALRVLPAGGAQRFVQSGGAGASRPQQLPRNAQQVASVLNDFTLRQSGNTVVLTDRDGSEFRGTVVAASSQNTRRAQTRNSAAKPQSSDADGGNEGYAFRASGLSRTLGKKVVIEAEVEPVAAAQIGADQDQAGATPGAKRGLARNALDQRRRVVGELRIDREVVEVDAVSE